MDLIARGYLPARLCNEASIKCRLSRKPFSLINLWEEKEENTWENEEEIFCALLAFFTAYAKNVIQKNFSNTFSQKNAEKTTTFRYLKLKASLY